MGEVGYKYVQNTLYKILKDQKMLLFVKENTNYIYLDLGHIGNISSKCIVVFGTRIMCGLFAGKTDA